MAKREKRPLILRVQAMVNPETGELVKCFVPARRFTKDELQARGYHIGDEVMGDVYKARNPKFWRLAHALGSFLRDNIDEFSGMHQHAILKKLQRDARIECDLEQADILGETVLFVKPKSLNFDDMDETRFAVFFAVVCEHIKTRYWPTWTIEQQEEMLLIVEGEQ